MNRTQMHKEAMRMMPIISDFGKRSFRFEDEFPLMKAWPTISTKKGMINQFGNVGFSTDIVEKDGIYQVEADLPGLEKDDINISLQGLLFYIQSIHLFIYNSNN